MEVKSVHTPCVGMCSTIYGDDVCRGCRRFTLEVVRWNGWSEEEKLRVIDRLGNQVHEILSKEIDVFDEARLKKSLEALSVRYYPQHASTVWAYQWLRYFAEKGKAPTELLQAGFRLRQSEMPVLVFISQIEARLYDRASRDFATFATATS